MKHLRFLSVLALLLVVTVMLNVSITSASTDYYLSGIVVGTDKATYGCGDQVEALTALYSGNVTVANLPVSVQITSPSGNQLTLQSNVTNSYGIASFSLLLPDACEVGVYTVTVTSQGKYNSVSSATKISIGNPGEYFALSFNKLWYSRGESLVLSGRVVTGCNLTLVNTQPIQFQIYAPDNTSLTSGSTQLEGFSFAVLSALPASIPTGLYTVIVYVLDPCVNRTIYGNAFFSVLSNLITRPWGISISSDKTVYEVGDQIGLIGSVTGGPYFFCQLGWACTGNGTYPPIDVSIQIIAGNGTIVYSRTVNVGLEYYSPSYVFQAVFSGYLNNSYLAAGTYLVAAQASTTGYPTVQTATSFTVTATPTA